MSTPLRVLLVEDSLSDAKLMVAQLREAGYDPEWQRVETEADYIAHLESVPDLILSDYTMPGFNGLRALQYLRTRNLDIPFIFVSGTIGEDVAVQAMREGAADYLQKDRPARLGQAVRRALEQKALRAKNRQAEEQLHLQASALAAAANGILIADRKGIIRWTNPAVSAMTGFAEEEMLGNTPRIFRSGQHDQAFYQGLWQTIMAGRVWKGEMVNRRKNGEHYAEEQTITPVRNQHGEIAHFIAIKEDITERVLSQQILKRTEDSLQAAEHRLQHVVTSSPVVLFSLAIAGDQIQDVSWISDNILNILGYSTETALRPDWWHENVHPDDRNKIVADTHAELFSGGSANHEYRFRHGNGSYRWTRGELRLIRDGNGQAVEVVGSWSDITKHKQLEEQFWQAQKMEAVGRLAGGVAHDFNNLLTIICGFGEILMTKLLPNDPGRPMLKQVVLAGERATMLTRQLLTFSRHHVQEIQQLDLNLIIQESATMLARLIGEDIQIELCLAPTLRPVLADPGHMNQVLMNLAVNARDAMRGGGRLVIETTNVDPDKHNVAADGSQAGSFVLLTVIDTGCGMDEATRLHIFEPFFTTKGPNEGTGLGLSTVYGIVHKCGGHIEVDSEVGRGTTFRIYLPQGEPAPRPNSPSPRKVLCAGGAETILLVEDDPAVRQFANLLLENRGYMVLKADGGAAALAVAERRKEPIQLLLTDVIMPNMSGSVLADRLKRIHPETMILFMSGYTGEALAHHRVQEPGTFFLQKPFTPESLAAKVRSVLDLTNPSPQASGTPRACEMKA